jgi:hypothetical protein
MKIEESTGAYEIRYDKHGFLFHANLSDNTLMIGVMPMSCWFCSIRDAEMDHVLAVDMYGDVNAQKTELQTKVAYNVQHVSIPRCADCHSRHIISMYADVLGLIFGVVFLVSILAAVFGWAGLFISGLWMGLAFGLLLGMLGIRFLALKGIYSVRDAKIRYPEVKKLQEKGYRFGFRPQSQLPKSNQPEMQTGDKTGKSE